MKLQILTSTFMAIILSSCSSKFTESQRTQLSSVMVARATQEVDVYKDPKGNADDTAAAVGMATGGGLVGALIGETVAASQNKMFKNKEEKNFGRLKSASPSSVASLVSKEVLLAAKQNPFFSLRLKSQSPNRIQSKVLSYSLTRTGKDARGLLMSPKIVANVQLVGPNGKNIGSKMLPAVGVGAVSYSVSEYIARPSLLKKGYTEAAQNLGQNVAEQLAKKTAE